MQHQQKIARYFLAISLLLNLLLHIPFVNLGPRSVHAWRQCNTLAVARNFYQENMNILKPRVDRRLDSDGVTGMQFPSYEYGLAVSYHVFGEHHANHRIWSLLISSIGAIGMFLLSRKLLRNPIAAALTASAYLFSPDLFYFGFSALPDILALACSVWGLYLFLVWHDEGRSIYYWLSMLTLILAGLTKIQFLAVGFFIAPLVLMDAKNKQRVLGLLLFGAACVVVPLSWYLYSVKLIENSGLYDFGLTFRPESDLQKGLQTIGKNLSSDLPDLLLNYASFLLLLFGIFIFFCKKLHANKYFYPMLCWALALVAYHLIELAQMDVHSYYMMPYLPLLLIIVGLGIRELLNKKQARVWAISILIVHPILASARIIPSRFTKQDPGIPIELYEHESRTRLQNAVPNSALCIVGPDISGCIYFYHLRKKGFGFDYPDQLFSNDDSLWCEYKQRGAQYLITNDSALVSKVSSKALIVDTVCQEGSFFVLGLR